ncbi:hypothetical protein BACUNI_01540 [Bacteroides uniformis ATCC 8492]|uniref:Uncharacterized protein n=1 Tax=Bacteroides uniformis (strain ATCC 8492 / DSM 6597 / CCUG 4942 / CIP 103695 / JCM 5828 / KCTC 5204 / NCTC 13054 / VPI 0061) TaxID=411479 RepID=A0ABC9NDY3_BACUC|nr:hypothetical protein BACUNI_01540 [Bacteroides uniformis ATCC 8492]DAY98536.1 MAG TPA: hypothetical protein [Caudoviricetes sp.]
MCFSILSNTIMNSSYYVIYEVFFLCCKSIVLKVSRK